MYVTAPGRRDRGESPARRGARRRARRELFCERTSRVEFLGRIRPEPVRDRDGQLRHFERLPDAELGENLEIDGPVKRLMSTRGPFKPARWWPHEAGHLRRRPGRPGRRRGDRPASTFPTCAPTSREAPRTSASGSAARRRRPRGADRPGRSRRPQATSASTRRSRSASAGRTRSRRGSCSSRTWTRSSASTTRSHPEHLTEELDLELELAVVIRKPGSGSRPRRRWTTSAGT